MAFSTVHFLTKSFRLRRRISLISFQEVKDPMFSSASVQPFGGKAILSSLLILLFIIIVCSWAKIFIGIICAVIENS